MSFLLCPGISWVLTWLLSLEISSGLLRQQPAKSCGKHCKKGSECGLVQHLPPCTFSILCTCPTFTASRTVPDSPLRCPAHQEVQQSCTNASEDSQSTEHTAGGSPLFCTCLPETQRQVFSQLMQARQCRPRACSELGSVHVSLLLSLLGGESAALD